MKKNNIYNYGLALTVMLATSCADLDTAPEGEVTGDQFTKSVAINNELLEGVAKSVSSTL